MTTISYWNLMWSGYLLHKEARYVQLDYRNVTFLYYEDNDEEWHFALKFEQFAKIQPVKHSNLVS